MKILIVDDEKALVLAIKGVLSKEGYQIETVKSPGAVLKAIESRDFSLVLMDLNYTRDTTSGQEGLDLLQRIQSMDANLPVVVMTAWGSVEIAVEAMRRGARDFIQKPWDNEKLLADVLEVVRGNKLKEGAVRIYIVWNRTGIWHSDLLFSPRARTP